MQCFNSPPFTAKGASGDAAYKEGGERRGALLIDLFLPFISFLFVSSFILTTDRHALPFYHPGQCDDLLRYTGTLDIEQAEKMGSEGLVDYPKFLEKMIFT